MPGLGRQTRDNGEAPDWGLAAPEKKQVRPTVQAAAPGGYLDGR
jgi:hypothetical protein